MMPNIYQSTITKPILFKGIGLHSGKKSTVKLLPAEAGQGVIFKRTDLKARNIIEANYKLVSSATLCTTLKNKFVEFVHKILYCNSSVTNFIFYT